jgi:hypothetical protein
MSVQRTSIAEHTSFFSDAQLAETEGFEPSVREFPVRRFSKPLVSATHPRLRMRGAQTFRGKVEHEQHRAGGYIRRFAPVQPERPGYFGVTSSRMSRAMDSPGWSTRMPSPGHSLSGRLSAALAWVTGSATKMPPSGGE